MRVELFFSVSQTFKTPKGTTYKEERFIYLYFSRCFSVFSFWLVEMRQKIMVAAVWVWHINYSNHVSQEVDRQGDSRTQYGLHSILHVTHLSKISPINQSFHYILKYCHNLETKSSTQETMGRILYSNHGIVFMYFEHSVIKTKSISTFWMHKCWTTGK